MTEADTDNMRSMIQMRNRSPIENAAYAMGALCDEDQVAAVAMFNSIWGDKNRPNWSRLTIELGRAAAA